LPIRSVDSYRLRSFLTSPFAVFTLLMTAKILMAWAVIFGGLSWQPLVTSLPSVWAAFALIELLASRRRLTAYLVVNLLLTSIYFAVIMYYKYFGIIVTYRALAQAGQVTEVKGSVMELMHPYFLLIFTDIVVLALALLWNRRLRAWGRRNERPSAGRRGAALLLLAVSAGLCLLAVLPNRGIVNELRRAQAMGIVNYEIDVLFQRDGSEGIDPRTVTVPAIRELKGITQPAKPVYEGAAAGRNVIVLQLEAFQTFLIGAKADGKEITPNLNRLAREGLYFPRFYQQAGAGNTSDAEFMTNTSLYVPAGAPATNEYAHKELPSLPRLFAAKGYEAVTFHTNDVAFWNRGNLYAALGFTRYYDTAFFGDEDMVHFGASDEVLYRKSTDELARLNASGKPVYANIIAMSAHHPFDLPRRKDKISLPERYDGTFVGDYVRSQNYADFAVGQLVEELKAKGLWETSMLVVYGDHMGVPVYSMTKEDRALMEELTGVPYDYSRMLNIPLLIVAPGALAPQTLPQVGGQTDIMPTIANLAGLSLADTPHFGQDLLNHTSNLLPERYYLPSGSFINDKVIFIPGNGFEDGQTIALPGEQTDGGLGPVTRDEFDRALRLLHMSNAYTEALPDRKK